MLQILPHPVAPLGVEDAPGQPRLERAGESLVARGQRLNLPPRPPKPQRELLASEEAPVASGIGIVGQSSLISAEFLMQVK